MERENINPMWREISHKDYSREYAFNLFNQFEVPANARTINIDVTKLLNFAKQNDLKFSMIATYGITYAANKVPELKHRIINDKIYEFDFVFPVFAALAPNKSVITVDGIFTGNFMSDYNLNIERIDLLSKGLIDRDRFDNQGHIMLSNIPWYSFTSLTFPYTKRFSCIPIFGIGKYYKSGDKVLAPLAIQTNHALVDGYHIGQFLEHLQNFCDHLSSMK